MKKILLLLSFTLITSLAYADNETITSGKVATDDNITTTPQIPEGLTITDNNSNAETKTTVAKDNKSNDNASKVDNATEDPSLLREQIKAEEDASNFNKYVAINASYYIPSGGKDYFNSNFSIGFLFGYMFFDFLGIEVGVSSQIKSKSTKYDIKPYLIAQYEITKFGDFPVFIYGGVGLVYSNLTLGTAIENQSSKSESSFNFGAKAGLRTTIAKRYNVGIVAEYMGAKFFKTDFSAVTIGVEAGIRF